MTESELAYYWELPGVYDGWSVAVYKDGTMKNRWANEDGSAKEGYESHFELTQQAILNSDFHEGSADGTT